MSEFQSDSDRIESMEKERSAIAEQLERADQDAKAAALLRGMRENLAVVTTYQRPEQ
jgi:hypothetical protein